MRCNICYISIKEEQKLIKCPRCLNPFHFDHLAAWLLNENTCPICRQQLSDAFRAELQPKSRSDRDKLIRIQRNLSMLTDSIDDWEARNKKRLKREHEQKFKEQERLRKKNRPKTNKLIPFLVFIAWMVVLILLVST